jgi:hypothetical protein
LKFAVTKRRTDDEHVDHLSKTMKPGQDYFMNCRPRGKVYQPYVNSKITSLLTEVDAGTIDLTDLRQCKPIKRIPQDAESTKFKENFTMPTRFDKPENSLSSRGITSNGTRFTNN